MGHTIDMTMRKVTPKDAYHSIFLVFRGDCPSLLCLDLASHKEEIVGYASILHTEYHTGCCQQIWLAKLLSNLGSLQTHESGYQSPKAYWEMVMSLKILRLAQQHDKGLTRCTEMRSRPISFRCMPPAQDKKCQWKLHAAAPIATRTSSNVPTADSLSGKRHVSFSQ